MINVESELSLSDAFQIYGDNRIFSKGETLFEEGKKEKHIHYIDRGKVALKKKNLNTKAADGKKFLVIDLAGQNNIIGWDSLLGESSNVTAVAIRETQVRTIPVVELHNILHTPALMKDVCEQIFEAQARTVAQRKLLIKGTNLQRVAGSLLDYMEEDNGVLQVSVTQTELGERASLVRENVNKVLKTFTERKILERRSVITPILIYQPDRLSSMVNKIREQA